MPDFAGFLCVLSIFLLLVTIIGHGLWVLAAKLLRALSGAKPQPRPGWRSCHRCGTVLRPAAIRCPDCGTAAATPPLAESADEVGSAARYIDWLWARGSLTLDRRERLLAILREPEVNATEAVGGASPFPASTPATPAAAASSLEPDVAWSSAETAEIVEAIVVGSAAMAAATQTAESPTATREPGRPVRPSIAHPAGQRVAAGAASPAPPHALDRDYPAGKGETAGARAAARRGLAELLTAFMAERNIRWGELISGILIVGSAVGLVISLRATLSDRVPYFPALIFMLITLAIHGAGLYTLRRWNLQSTSRGVLLIALLLTPLNFLAAVTLSGREQRPVTDPMYVVAVGLGLLAAGWITYSAGRALLREGWWRLSIAVLGTSVGQLVIDRQTPGHPGLLQTSLLMALPLGGFLLATLEQLRRGAGWLRLSGERSRQILTVFGVSAFALAIPLGLFAAQLDSLQLAFAQLSPVISLASASMLGTGLSIQRRARAKRMAPVALIGTALAALGGLLMAIAVALAWPEPLLLVVVGLANFAILTLLAAAGNLPPLHVGAIACAALAAVVGVATAQGWVTPGGESSRHLIAALLMGRSSLVLTAVVGCTAAAAWGWWRIGRRGDAASCLAGAGMVAVAAVAVAALAGFVTGRDGALASPVLAGYGVLLLVAAAWSRLPQRWTELRRAFAFESAEDDAVGKRFGSAATQVMAWAASILLFSALLHAVWRNDATVDFLGRWGIAPQHPALFALVSHALGILGVVAVLAGKTVGYPLCWRGASSWYGVIEPLVRSAAAAAVLGLPAAVWVGNGDIAGHAGYVLAIGLVALGLSLLYRSGILFSAFQALSTLGVAYAVAGICHERIGGDGWLSDPQHYLAQLAALSAWSAVWPLLRRGTERWQAARAMLDSRVPAMDQWLQGSLLVAFLLYGAAACWPGILAELGIGGVSLAGTAAWLASGQAWIALAVIATAVACFGWERLTVDRITLLALLLACGCLLAAAGFAEVTATASAARWLGAGYALLTAVAVWAREPLAQRIDRCVWLRRETVCEGDLAALRHLVLAIGALPVLALTTLVVIRSVQDLPLGGPSPESVFARMGTTFSYGAPLLALVAVLCGHAIRERCEAYALAGSAVFQYLVTLAYLLHASPEQPGFWAGLLLWNAVAATGYALLWLGLQPWMRAAGRSGPAETAGASGDLGRTGGTRGAAVKPLAAMANQQLANDSLWRRFGADWTIQFTAAVTLLGIACAWSAVAIFASPGSISSEARALGQPLSHLAWLLGAAALGARWWQQARSGVNTWRDPSWWHASAWFAVGLMPLLAMVLDRWDSLHHWHAFHGLMAGWLAVAAALTASAVAGRGDWRLASLVGSLPAILAFRGSTGDPHVWAPWWSVSAAAGSGVLAAALGLATRRSRFSFASVALAASAATFAWMGTAWGRAGWSLPTSAQSIANLLAANIVVVGLTAAGWLAADLWCQRVRGEAGLAPAGSPRVHPLATLLGLAAAGVLLVWPFLVNSLAGNVVVDAVYPAGIASLGVLGLLVFAALWDRPPALGLGGVYVWGGLAVVLLLNALHLEWRPAFFAATAAAAGYVALTGLLWNQGAWFANGAREAGIRDPVGLLVRASNWLPTTNLLLAAVSAGAALLIVMFYPERDLRIFAGFVPALLALGIGATAQQERRSLLQVVALLSLVLAAVTLSWADIGPVWHGGAWLSRLIRLLIVFSAGALIYGVGAPRAMQPLNLWSGAVRRAAAICGAGAAAALAAVLLTELATFRPHQGAPIDALQLGAVAAVLAALAAGLIALAVLPQRDPLQLSERGRMGYVYAAELIGLLLFVHLFLCRPEWFAGFLRPYWPYVVLGIAFLGVGLGEVFQRSGWRVLAEPLQRSGAFLPLVPALGFWVVAAEGASYSLLLFFAGVLYVLVSMTRRSTWSGVAAAIAGNGALWSLLVDTGFEFWRHPQFWLIPPALSVLAAGHWNRQRLTDAQQTGLRYGCMLTVYLSSASEIFVRGVGESLWPPMMLALLSVAGVFLGIVLQIRAFLYLGAGFVLLSIVSMVWHAARAIEHVWPWWAFGIGLGICILVFFGIFEKQRPEIVSWVERLQRWDG